VLPLTADLEVSFCVDRANPGHSFDASDEALLHILAEGLEPLAMSCIARNGLAPGQERLDEDERQLVASLLEGCEARDICAELDISEDVLDGRRETMFQKLGVRSELGLLQLCAWGSLTGVPKTANTKVTTGQPRPSEESTVTVLLPRAREVVLEQLEGADLSVDSVARRLGVSSRTLQRKLSAAHTSFTKLVDGARRERASALLTDTSLGYIDVALELGYDHVSSFNRAVQRWFETTPSELRRRASDEE
jgi:AraC-like DNA-binding protein/DNA-binding CsgD family transcriptional regulator